MCRCCFDITCILRVQICKIKKKPNFFYFLCCENFFKDFIKGISKNRLPIIMIKPITSSLLNLGSPGIKPLLNQSNMKITPTIKGRNTSRGVKSISVFNSLIWLSVFFSIYRILFLSIPI